MGARLFDCKFFGADEAGARVDDVYVVCEQAHDSRFTHPSPGQRSLLIRRRHFREGDARASQA